MWGIYTFVTGTAGLTKEVVFHKDGLSKGVLLYVCTVQCCNIIVIMLVEIQSTVHSA